MLVIPQDYIPSEDVVDEDFYAIQVRKTSLRKKVSCVHAFWIVKCSVCGEVLGSETKPDKIVDIIRTHAESHVII